MDSLKKKFFLYHLLASAFIVILVSSICQFFWFPAPFLLIDGTWIALLTLALVDIVIGPLLTLVLVSSKKSSRELLFDMLVIIAIQTTALSYGLIKIEQERVWAIVHLDGVFNLVPKKEILPEHQLSKHSLPQYQEIYYAMVLNSELLLHSNLSTKPLMYSPERFHAIEKREMLAKAIPHNKLPYRIKTRYNEQHTFKALIGKQKDAIVVLDMNMTLIDILLLDNGEVTLPQD